MDEILQAQLSFFEGLADGAARVLRLLPDLDRELAGHDPQTYVTDLKRGNSLRHRSIVFRYALPMLELTQPGAPEQTEIRILCGSVLWWHHWRRFDDLLDQPTRTHANAPEAQRYALLAYSYAAANLPSGLTEHRLRSIVAAAAAATAEVEFQRQSAPLDVSSNWTRLALPLIPLELFGCGARALDLYREYLNIMILAHDVTDVVSDTAEGVKSYPAEAYLGSGTPLFHKKSLRRFIERAEEDMTRRVDALRADLRGVEAPLTLDNLDFVLDELFR